MDKSPEAFRTISEVAEWLGVQPHVLRFWESKFSQVRPVKRAGGRRYYRPADMLLLGGIRQLLYEDGLTIKGAQKVLREEGMAHVSSLSQPLESDAPPEPDVIDITPRPVEEAETVVSFGTSRTIPQEEAAPEPETAAPESQDAADETDGQLEMPGFFSSARRGTEAPEPEEGTAERAAQADAESEPAAAAAPKPRIVNAPDPDETTFTLTPSALSAAFRARALSQAQRAQITPLVARLAALRDRLAAERGPARRS